MILALLHTFTHFAAIRTETESQNRLLFQPQTIVLYWLLLEQESHDRENITLKLIRPTIFPKANIFTIANLTRK